MRLRRTDQALMIELHLGLSLRHMQLSVPLPISPRDRGADDGERSSSEKSSVEALQVSPAYDRTRIACPGVTVPASSE